jgi:hypothetical protein
MIVTSLLLAMGAAQPAADPPPTPPTRSRFEKVETPDQDVPVGSRVQRTPTYVTASEHDSAWVLHRLAECLVRTRPEQMLELLSTRLNSGEQTRIVRDVIGWRTRCLQARSMALDNILLRGAVAEALYRQELRGRSVGRIDQAPPPLAGDPARNSAVALERFGRCMATRYPDRAEAIIGTRPGSDREEEALDRITEVLPDCLPAAPRRARHPQLLRGAIGEAFYLNRHGFLAGSGAMAAQDAPATSDGVPPPTRAPGED